ncbi:hypothetical protein [Pseudomonas sp.]|uniref:hypothetical protein n=1 Tax=Pseudomonas sp. TaxID=306 RepID=UPI0027344528|nr:hypothetical protein [Pseudomonas sp.]MDP3815697.1 hypothetical protein [Pseudomonas sp.]
MGEFQCPSETHKKSDANTGSGFLFLAAKGQARGLNGSALPRGALFLLDRIRGLLG